MIKLDPLGLIEVAYRFDNPPEHWLRDVATATYEQVGSGLGMVAFPYCVTPETRVKVGQVFTLGVPDTFGEQMRVAVEQLPPSYVSKTFLRCECTTQSEFPDEEVRAYNAPIREAMAASFGWRDVFMLGGMDPSGHGIYIGTWLGKETRLPARTRATWSRVAVHLATAHRLHRNLRAKLSPEAADAVLDPDGHVDHATGGAEQRAARDALRDAVKRVEDARGQLRHRDPDKATEAWKGLVDARWSLVDHFSAGGRRYVLARRNDVALNGGESLTDRERQALGYAALGHNNKLIAYEMGVSPSTVGVLLHRAAHKLNASNREEMIARFIRLS
jgi:DNA-binding CsgD family transcriptional regulator